MHCVLLSWKSTLSLHHPSVLNKKKLTELTKYQANGQVTVPVYGLSNLSEHLLWSAPFRMPTLLADNHIQ